MAKNQRQANIKDYTAVGGAATLALARNAQIEAKVVKPTSIHYPPLIQRDSDPHLQIRDEPQAVRPSLSFVTN